MSNNIGRKILISELEGVFHDFIENNDRKIRYPIRFNDNTQLRGNYILRVDPDSEKNFFSGKYVFGANDFYIYKAIDALLDKLVTMGLIDDFELDMTEEELEEEYDEKYL